MPAIKFVLRNTLVFTLLFATASVALAQKAEKKKEKDYAQLVDPLLAPAGMGIPIPVLCCLLAWYN